MLAAASTRTASFVLVPVTSFAGYATYVRTNSKPSLAHSEFSQNNKKWRKVNNGLGLVDVGRSGGGL